MVFRTDICRGADLESRSELSVSQVGGEGWPDCSKVPEWFLVSASWVNGYLL